MRSFLIRDILSGPASAPGQSQGGSAGDNQHPASSSLDCVAARSLAASQARFLAKLAEHQQQVQASKYYEQLQHHQQLLNLNLNHHSLQLHQQQLLQQQQHLQQINNNGSTSSGRSATNRIGSSGATFSSNYKPKQKTSSFAYDCTSPILSISDVERGEDDEDEGRGVGCEDDDDEDEIEIEVEKLSGEESKAGRHLIRRQNKSHRAPNDNRLDDDNQDEEDYNDDDDDDDDEEEEEEEEDVGDNNNGSNRLNPQQQQQQMKGQQLIGKQLPPPFQLNSPLDALFQMTSSTFDALKRGEKRKDREADHHGSTNFTSKQTSKKKRKSRTAFTNNQIYELERRFREQKYLSPTDRDEIAMALNLSNAQVITWFQNRRAKLKRDLEEQKRDIETASLLNFQKTFFESFQALSQIKTAIKTDAICRTDGTGMHEEI